MDAMHKELCRMAKVYMDYLNGPVGRFVLDRMQEGETFELQIRDRHMLVKKKEGKAIVSIEPDILASPEEIDDLLTKARYQEG